VLVDQFIDRSFAREKSFFGDRRASRMSRWRIRSAPGWATALEAAGRGRPAGDARRHLSGDGGAAILHQGRERTVSQLGLRRVIGMTNMPEAKLAREAELCYATVAMVTDFDCWHPTPSTMTT
jgi:5'-methylthioadenosine phosphorylase